MSDVTDALYHCKEALNTLFGKINDTVVSMQALNNDAKALLLIKHNQTAHATEFYILCNISVNVVSTTTQTESPFTAEVKITGEGIHCLSGMNTNNVYNLIRGAVYGDSEIGQQTAWDDLCSNIIFYETGSFATTALGTEGTGFLTAENAIGLNTVKFGDDTIIMDSFEKSRIKDFLQWTQTRRYFMN